MTRTAKQSSVDDWLDSIDTSIVEARDGVRLRAIAEALEALEAAEARLESAVAAAKSSGESWNAIGVVLGTSRQAAHRKFAR